MVILKSRRAEPEGTKRLFGGKWHIKTAEGWKPLKSSKPQQEDAESRQLKPQKEEKPSTKRTPPGKRPTRQNIQSAATPADPPAERERKLKSRLLLATKFLQEHRISPDAAKAAFLDFKDLSPEEQKRTPLSVYLMKEAKRGTESNDQ